MKTISTWFARISTGWLTLLALLVFVLFMLFVLPAQASEAEEVSAGAGSPDTTFLYRTDDLYAMAEAYGEAGRASYIRARFRFDLVFPLVYGAFLVTSVSWLADRVFADTSPARLANLVPFMGVLFDFLENGAASLVMARFPQQTPVVDVLAPVFSLLKWVFLGAAFLLLFILAGSYLVRRRIAAK